MTHLLRILCLSSLFIPQFFVDTRLADGYWANGLGMVALVTLCYILVQLFFQLKPRTSSLFQGLCFLPLVLPACCSMLDPIYLLLAYMLCMPLTLLAYSLVNRPSSIFWQLVNMGVICYIWGIFVAHLLAPAPLYDIWQLYDLSRSFTNGDFYRMDLIRQAEYFSEYSTGFPLGYPALLALVDNFTGMGLRGFLLISFGAFAAIALCVRQIFIRHGVGHLWGLVTLFLFVMPRMLFEIGGGGTTMFSLLFILATYSLVSAEGFYQSFVAKKGHIGRAALLGLFLGLGCMIRFDFLTFTLMVLMAWGVFCLYKRNFLPFLATLLVFFCCISPWVYYSLSHFNHPYVMDNSRRIMSVTEMGPGSYFPDKESVQTLLTHPIEWAEAKFIVVKEMVKEFARFILNNIILILLPLFALYLLIHRKPVGLTRFFYFTSTLTILLCSAYIPLLFLVGYRNNERYYIPFFAVLSLISFIIIASAYFKEKRQPHSIVQWAPLCILVVLWGIQATWHNPIWQMRQLRHQQFPMALTLEKMTDEEIALRDYIIQQHGADSRLWISILDHLEQRSIYAARFASQAGITIMQVPSTIASVDDFSRMIEQYRLNLLLCKEGERLERIKQGASVGGYTITLTDFPNLYSIQK